MDSMDWNRFDFRCVAMFSGNADRVDSFWREIHRVGMTNVDEFWTSESPYERFIHAAIRKNRLIAGSPRALSVTLKHLNMAKVALERGAESMLVLEDDVRFLRDVDRLAEIVGALPDGYDIAMFGVFPSDRARRDPGFVAGIEARAVCDGWSAGGDEVRYRSTSCYALSRKGAKRYVELLEGAAFGRNPMLNCDQFLGRLMASPDLRTFLTWPNASIQAVFANCNSGAENVRTGYASLGIDRSLYQSYPGEVPA